MFVRIAGLPTPRRADALSAYAHIDASILMKRRSYDSFGVPIDERGILTAIRRTLIPRRRRTRNIMKMWSATGVRASMNLVMIGHFDTVHDANDAHKLTKQADADGLDGKLGIGTATHGQ